MRKKPANIETLTRQLHTLTVQRDNARKLAEVYEQQRDDFEKSLSSLRKDAAGAKKEAERLLAKVADLHNENTELRNLVKTQRQFISIIEALSKRP